MIALYRGKSIVSKLIRWQTRSEYSHAAWLCEDGSVYEAWNSGFERNLNLGKAHLPGTVIDLFDIDGLTPEKRRVIEAYFDGELGAPYDYWGVLKFLSRRDAPSDDRWFCSEVVTSGLYRAGLHIFNPGFAPPWKVYPGELAFSPLTKFHRRIIV